MAGCMGDSGYVAGEAIRSGALAKVALAKTVVQTLQAGIAADMAYDAFRKKVRFEEAMLDIEEEQHAHLTQVYWPRELSFLAEFVQPEQLETVSVIARRHTGRLNASISRVFAEEIRKLRHSGTRYNSSYKVKSVNAIYLARSEAQAHVKMLGWIMGVLEVQEKTDLNLQRRHQAIGIGKHLMGEAAKLYGQGLKGLDVLGQTLSGSLSSALTSLGFSHKEYESARLNSQTIKDRSADDLQWKKENKQSLRTTTTPLKFDTDYAIDNIGKEAKNIIDTYQPQASFDSTLNAYSSIGDTRGSDHGIMPSSARSHGNDGNEGRIDLVLGGIAAFPVSGGAVTIDTSEFMLVSQAQREPGDFNIEPYDLP